MFQKEFEFFKRNQRRLVGRYKGKILVIRGNRVAGVYPSTLEAYQAAIKQWKPGTFMIQSCEPGPEAYSVTINSRGIARY